MSITIRRAALWRTETANTPGTLAATLEPLAAKRANLEVVMGYASPDKSRAAVEVFPVRTPVSKRAARAAGFSPSSFPCVVISGENRPGIGHQVAAALAEADININFFVAQTFGNHYTGLFSFEAATEADLAVQIIRRAMNPRRRTAGKRRPARPRPASPRARRRAGSA